jgi:hypothetical protein
VKQDASFFEGHNPQLVFIAKRLRDAKRLESVFEEAGIDYGVETDEYVGGVVFRRTRIGAFFYVRPESKEAAVSAMTGAGFSPATES